VCAILEENALALNKRKFKIIGNSSDSAPMTSHSKWRIEMQLEGAISIYIIKLFINEH
jgi:hypothetical protein